MSEDERRSTFWRPRDGETGRKRLAGGKNRVGEKCFCSLWLHSSSVLGHKTGPASRI